MQKNQRINFIKKLEKVLQKSGTLKYIMKSEIYSEVPKSRRSSLHDVIRANSNKNFKKQIFFI